MRSATPACVALALAGGCIRERPPRAADAGATEALRPSPGRELRRTEEKPDVAVVAVAAPPAPPPPSIEERLRRCYPAMAGSVVRLTDELAYAAEATARGTIVRVVRVSAGESVCERYETAAGAAQAAWPGAQAPGRVVLATAVGRAPGAALVELGAGGVIRAVGLLDGACAPSSTLRPVQLFAGAPSIQVRCWVATEGYWTAVDQVVHRDARGWQTLTSSESGRVARPAGAAAPPPNPTLPGYVRVIASGATPRLEVATSSVDQLTGSTKFALQTLTWSAAGSRFLAAATPIIDRRRP